ncbi:MAG: hypothetical protein JWO76_832, partial [Nocardioides sp.]|nr:hypothetical protein [Nocardioides sp.]
DGPQQPEYLERGGGTPRRPGSEPGATHGRRNAIVGAGVVVGLALVGGGIWAATSFFGTGPQPSEALPDTTLGYLSVDLDPSGGQKLEALKTLRKFPAFKDRIGLDTDDDIREKLFTEIQKDAGCEGLDYADDIEPWIGDRAAIAAVDTGAEQPTPVFVVQVTDEEKADAGLNKLQDCATGGAPDSAGGWAIEGGWAVLAETDDLAQGVVDDAADAPLSDDADFQTWTDEVGDPGIVTMYAAPAAGDYLAESLGSLGMLVPQGTTGMTDALKDFKGMAATIRFADGALELEVAGDPGTSQSALYATDKGDDVLATLPEDTAAGIGVGFAGGWFSDVVDQMASYSGGETSAEELLSQLSAESGLDLPEDAETLAGESAAVGIGSDFDPDAFDSSSDGSDAPIAAKVQGDPDAIEAVLAKLTARMEPEEATALGTDSDGDLIAIGPDADYRSEVLGDGDLGDSDVFQDVVPDAGIASVIFFINFDAGDGWLVKAADGDPEVADNLEPLSGLGISGWQEDDVAHGLVRITTN